MTLTPANKHVNGLISRTPGPVSYTHLRAHETRHDLVCRLLLEKTEIPGDCLLYTSDAADE